MTWYDKVDTAMGAALLVLFIASMVLMVLLAVGCVIWLMGSI